MMKAIANTTDGKQVVLLGLTLDNVRRLVNGKPVLVHGRDLKDGGFPEHIDIVIMYGDDIESIMGELSEAGIAVPGG